MAHEFLKQKKIEKREEISSTANSIQNTETQIERPTETVETSQRSQEDHTKRLKMSDSVTANQQVRGLLQGSWISTSPLSSFLGEYLLKFYSLVKSQSHISLVLAIAFAVILLMQVSIVVLLNRPQHIHVVSPADYMGGGASERSSEAMAWLEKRIHYFKDEMVMVEARLERMWHQHAVLKKQLKDLEQLRKQR
ncbi:protein VASCULAR ASSOCIATED DEATH 1, chloroplastic-like [Carica papaya]|uniref:protein VASCULAR ASSOCIATED DEATH 1, chloroplastic-like n=1 Tax=Carica papaya TaxID=3649 RepID=UPI000B8D197D|nr:protein VASCULAR ASSOCIATED DEATH 1, chloroplastic-like [Carica papaya]